ncbi:hypothetical protein CF319_g4771 [Tilletia indica]|nr:hypothetical protein CF319_g4771 [Tilletia indica]
MAASIDGIVLGITDKGAPATTPPASISSLSNISEQWGSARTANAKNAKPGLLRVFYPSSADQQQPVVAAVSLGAQKAAPSTAPDALPTSADVYLRNERLERTRAAAGKGTRALRDASTYEGADELPRRTFAVDSMHSPHAAAEGANLAAWTVNHFKTKGATPRSHSFRRDPTLQGGKDITIVPLTSEQSNLDDAAKRALVDAGDELKGKIDPAHQLSWYTGETYAQAQNLAREWAEMPANFLTPSTFCARAQDAFKGVPNTSVIARDEAWAKEKKMNTFLSVAAGTDEPAKFLEIHYTGATAAGKKEAPTLAFVGKGITFDSGGISLKPGANMKLMRADMGGAAAVVAAAWAIAKLGLPINLSVVTPLTENMPSGKATKPGDIIETMKGLTVEVDNTDAEGRLVLADALTYVSRDFKPHTIIDVATLTGAVLHALGHVYSAAFVEDESLWQEIKAAGEAEADPFWRMPLSESFLYSIDSSNADLCNRGMPAGSAVAAIFLKQFVEGLPERGGDGNGVRYLHADIAGSMEDNKGSDYQDRALTGRPPPIFSLPDSSTHTDRFARNSSYLLRRNELDLAALPVGFPRTARAQQYWTHRSRCTTIILKTALLLGPMPPSDIRLSDLSASLSTRYGPSPTAALRSKCEHALTPFIAAIYRRHARLQSTPNGSSSTDPRPNPFAPLTSASTDPRFLTASRSLSSHAGTVWSISPSPLGAKLAIGCEDVRVRLIDIAQGRFEHLDQCSPKTTNTTHQAASHPHRRSKPSGRP